MVDLVCVLPFLALFFVRFIFQHFDALSATGLVFAGLRYREKLAHLVLGERKRKHNYKPVNMESSYYLQPSTNSTIKPSRKSAVKGNKHIAWHSNKDRMCNNQAAIQIETAIKPARHVPLGSFGLVRLK